MDSEMVAIGSFDMLVSMLMLYTWFCYVAKEKTQKSDYHFENQQRNIEAANPSGATRSK